MHPRLWIAFALAFTLQAAEPYDLGALKWRSIGPNRGGRSLTAAGTARRPYEYYFGATGGGLWKTTDGCNTWRPVTDGQIRSSSVGAVAVSEANPDVVSIGMGETQLRSNVIQGDGVYKSVDAGKTWKHLGVVLAKSDLIDKLEVVLFPSIPRLVKILMRRDCSIGVGRRDVLDSGCLVANRAQAEHGRGRAERCSCLGDCVLRDNGLGTG
jgi:hypothetical protein